MTRGWKVVVAHIAVAAVLLGALGVWWWLRDGGDSAPADATAADAGAAVAGNAQEESAPGGRDGSSTAAGQTRNEGDTGAGGNDADPLPLLEESDGFVRTWLVARAPLAWMEWRVRDDLVRLAAVVLEYGARGQVPRRSLSFVTVEPFEVREEAEGLFIPPQSYARYDAVVEAALALPAEDAAALFTLLEPLLAEAIRELGVLDSSPRDMLERAIDHVLATPIVTGPVALTRPKVYYEFADPTLEALAPLQKQLLRTGPANLGKVRDHAKRLRAALTPR